LVVDQVSVDVCPVTTVARASDRLTVGIGVVAGATAIDSLPAAPPQLSE